MTVSSHQRSTVHSILKFVFLEIQNKAIRPVLSGPVTYIVSFKELSPMHSTIELSPMHSTIHQLGLVGVGSDPTSDTMSSNNKLTMEQRYNHMHVCMGPNTFCINQNV